MEEVQWLNGVAVRFAISLIGSSVAFGASLQRLLMGFWSWLVHGSLGFVLGSLSRFLQMGWAILRVQLNSRACLEFLGLSHLITLTGQS